MPASRADTPASTTADDPSTQMPTEHMRVPLQSESTLQNSWRCVADPHETPRLRIASATQHLRRFIDFILADPRWRVTDGILHVPQCAPRDCPVRTRYPQGGCERRCDTGGQREHSLRAVDSSPRGVRLIHTQNLAITMIPLPRDNLGGGRGGVRVRCGCFVAPATVQPSFTRRRCCSIRQQSRKCRRDRSPSSCHELACREGFVCDRTAAGPHRRTGDKSSHYWR